MYNKERIERTLEKLEQMGLSQMIISNPYSIMYLTGEWVTAGKRTYALYLNKNGNHKFILNKLFHVGETGLDEIWLSDTDDYIAALVDIIDPNEVLGVDETWSAKYIIPLMEKIEGLKCKISSPAVDSVRSVKSEEELELMRKSSEINDLVMMRAMNRVREGATEKEVSKYMQDQYLLEGCQNTAFPPIVAYGDSASDPHAKCSDRVPVAGDCVLIDTGCIYKGYCSDMTRTFFYQSGSDYHKEVHEIVLQANLRAIEAIRPGVRISDLDAIARDYITEKGYGQYFTHRLGHFIGLEGHEAGDVNALNQNLAEVGNVFSVEPGIYIPGEVGVRIEDLLVVTETGCENLNKVDKNIQYCGL